LKLIAKTLQGLEELLAEELKNLGAENIELMTRGVSFEGDKKLMYRANLEVRTALRILMSLDHEPFVVQNEDDLYDGIRAIDWSQYMDVDDTLAVNGRTFSSKITHSQYLALKTKDAIVDQFRDKTGKRPSVDLDNPTIRISVHINGVHEVRVSLDSSGDPLYKRGYRVETLLAPINEVLAAGLVMLSGWDRNSHFMDGMCGSGTIPIEAAMIAYDIAPQLQRKHFGFQNWQNFDKDLWDDIVHAARTRHRDFEHTIIGYDRDFRAMKAARQNIFSAALDGKVEARKLDFEKLLKIPEKGVLIMNPPYDVRLHDQNIEELYEMIGNRLKAEFAGYEAWILTSNFKAMKRFGLRPSRKIPLFNGSLECKFYKFEMYEGSKKAKYQ